MNCNAPARLAMLLTDWDKMSQDEKTSDAGRIVAAEIRGIGQGVSYLGGYDGMHRLETETARVGAPTSYLNRMWDGIGDWVA